MSKRPRDVAITPNGARALVRATVPFSLNPSYTDGITLWDTRTGNEIQITCTDADYRRGEITPGYASDAIAITNDIAVVIGEYKTVPTSEALSIVIDVLRISGSSPTCLKHIGWGGQQSPPPVLPPAGLASDVAITPDGAYAVVHCRNYIFVIPLGNDAADPHQMFDISPIPSGADPLATEGTYPGPQSDSVAVTNTHAVVVTTRDHETTLGVRSPHTYAYVVDLTLDPPQIVLESYIGVPSSISDRHPHDVAITPNGNLAVVALNEGAALINLRGTPALVGTHYQQGFTRNYSLLPRPVDSVEVTNTYAVMLSMEGELGAGGPEGWALHVLKLVDSNGLPLLTNLGTFKASTYPGYQPPDWPHDLAIWSDGSITRAVAKTQDSDITIDVSATPTVARFVSDAAPFHPLSEVFVSDSVVLGVPTPTQQWAMTIGAKQNLSTSRLEMVTGRANVALPGPFTYATVGDPTYDTFPSDIALGRTTWDAVIRCAAPPDEPSPAQGGRDFFRYILFPPPFTEQVRYGGQGDRILALDSMVYGVNAAVSVSEYALQTVASPGRVHFTAPTTTYP